MTRLAVLHPGEMGAAVGAQLVRAGHDVGWLPAGRSDASRDRAEASGLRALDDLSGVDVVFSICPPGAAVATARSLSGFPGLVVDANAISPQTAAEVSSLVAGYVDGGLVGGPPSDTEPVDLLLSGDRADEVAALCAGSAVRATVLDAGPFAASAVKLTYAAWTKIGQALLLAADATARELGVEATTRALWADGPLPDVGQRLSRAAAAAAKKGWRWEDEMLEIARTMRAAGVPDGFAQAAAELFGDYPRPS